MDVKFFEGKCYQPDSHLQGESRVEDSNATNSILTIDAFQEETGYADFENAVFESIHEAGKSNLNKNMTKTNSLDSGNIGKPSLMPS